MPRHLVCLSFDLPVPPDEDAAIAAARVLDLLADRGLRATWFVAGTAAARPSPVGERLVRDGHEIALLGPPSGGEAEAEQGVEAVRRLAGKAPRGFRADAASPVDVAWLERTGVLYDSSRPGLGWWPRRRRAGADAAASDSAVIAMPITLALGEAPAPARAVMQDWTDEVLQMRDSVSWGVLTCALPLATVGRGAVLRAFATFLDGALDAGAVVLTLEEAAREAAGRIGAA
ncbi:hypothetical protein PQJ75_09230 [Rhodoplanes sp. TEM]|uniref:Chitooligosaccharide deacetylase n=1 Tax=Rhodoplanes tepidamans TaxID=200616 RepID=A0ABT5JCZ8_RHOTP|nr:MULTISPECIES: polysaccharide deacetylase family protein [Rhodoplanes]MDC7787499.1 hypothetical protein [Rhodoplanes tepidamans]MDC7983910.1 hypothetical protein [Rhodoplanes sp. TEM]MDQ0354349.1 hypothetical protein [Rhodoplanes tepidamans]